MTDDYMNYIIAEDSKNFYEGQTNYYRNRCEKLEKKVKELEELILKLRTEQKINQR